MKPITLPSKVIEIIDANESRQNKYHWQRIFYIDMQRDSQFPLYIIVKQNEDLETR